MARIPCSAVSFSLLLFLLVGCASFELPRTRNSPATDASRPAVRCLCVWQPVETEDATGQPVRGFGGQVYFFAADSEEPVAVTGDVRVYVFDDTGTPEEQTRPKDIQNYDSLVWKSFLNKSQFGANYSLFVPYQQPGRYEAVCSLRLRLVQPDGTSLFSEMATVKLGGKSREDSSVRHLVSPREHSISPERSRELRVDLQRRGDSSDRATTIGSIKEGNLSLSNNDTTSDQILDDHARLKIQRYEARLAEMHAAYEQSHDRQQHHTRSIEQDIQDLMPAIREVSRGRANRQRVRPAAHEVFSAEEPQPVEHARFNEDRSQSSVWGEYRFQHASQPTSASRSEVEIHTFSRPLNRRRNSVEVPVWSDETQLQALQLARISE
jgi:hypothetical protein